MVRKTGSSAGVFVGAVRLNVIVRVGSDIGEKPGAGSPTAMPGFDGDVDSLVGSPVGSTGVFEPWPSSSTGRGVSLLPAGVGIGVRVGSAGVFSPEEQATSAPSKIAMTRICNVCVRLIRLLPIITYRDPTRSLDCALPFDGLRMYFAREVRRSLSITSSGLTRDLFAFGEGCDHVTSLNFAGGCSRKSVV